MPFKSRAQRRKFAQLLVEGKITDEAYERWNRDTGRKELPDVRADHRYGLRGEMQHAGSVRRVLPAGTARVETADQQSGAKLE